MVAMIIAGLLGVALASYLLMVRGHYAAVNRSQSWNAALALAEAGAEEALALLNPGAASPPPALAGNGWKLSEGAYRLSQESRRLTNGCSYAVIITNEPGRMVLTNYVIYSTGYATVPSSSTPLSRVLRVTITNAPLFTAALAAKSNITMMASREGGVLTDSFDSQDPKHSDRGNYPADTHKTMTNGDVACLSGTVMIGSDVIHGDLLLGPLTRIGPNGVFGKVSRDFNVDFPDVPPPFATAVPPISGSANGTEYTYLLTGGNYMLSSGTLKGRILVTGMAVLYVTRDASVNFAASDSILIATNASLKLYVGSPSASLPNVVNTGTPDRFAYFGLPSNTRLFQEIYGDFIGSIYAPSADFTINAGAGVRCDFVGSCMAGSLTINNHCSFHFDENLLRAGNPMRGYVVSSWREL
jgi:hypothetical protein